MIEKPVALYCYYAYADRMYVNELKKHLAFLEKQGLLKIWDDRNISPGADFRKERLSLLNNTDILLIFVSPDFLESDDCFGAEMQQMMQRHASGEIYSLPILLRPVFWQGTSFDHIQPLPQNGIPVTSKSWSHLDEALLEVTQGIVIVLQKLLGDQFNLAQTFNNQETPREETPQLQKKAQSQFDMRGQFVKGNQYNVGHDMNLKIGKH